MARILIKIWLISFLGYLSNTSSSQSLPLKRLVKRKLVDERTNEPLVGTVVALSNRLEIKATTDCEGVFTLNVPQTLIEDDRINILFDRCWDEDAWDGPVSIDLSDKEDYKVPIPIRRNCEQLQVSICGKLLSKEKKEPRPGVRVSIDTIYKVTDGEGKFQITLPVSSQNQDLEIEYVNCGSTQHSSVKITDDAKREGKQEDTILVPQCPLPTITKRLIFSDADSTPVRGAKITITNIIDGLSSSSDGYFSFSIPEKLREEYEKGDTTNLKADITYYPYPCDTACLESITIVLDSTELIMVEKNKDCECHTEPPPPPLPNGNTTGVNSYLDISCDSISKHPIDSKEIEKFIGHISKLSKDNDCPIAIATLENDTTSNNWIKDFCKRCKKTAEIKLYEYGAEETTLPRRVVIILEDKIEKYFEEEYFTDPESNGYSLSLDN